MPLKGRSLNWWRRWQAAFGSNTRQTSKRQSHRRRSPLGGRVEMLEARELLTVTYNGGALLDNVQAQAVYLGSAWNSNASLESQAKSTDQFLSTLVGPAYMNMLSIYNVGTGTDTAGVVNAANLGTSISDSQIQSDLAQMIANGQVQAPTQNNLYMVYVEPGVVVQMGSASSQTSFLGYHGAFGDGGKVIHYAVMAYPGSPNPSPGSQGFASTFDELTAVSSHELAEAVTDANVNYSTLGWYDNQNNGEIADLANGRTSTITGSSGTQYVVSDVVNQNDQVITPTSGNTGGGGSGGGGGVTTTLASPTLSGSAASSTAANLSWNLVSGATAYNVYQVSGGSASLLGTVSATTSAVEVTGLKAGSSDSFMVEAVNSAGAVGDSNVVTVSLPAPAVPKYVTAPQVTYTIESSTSVQLKWTAESQATGYNIYWSNGYQVLFLGSVSGSTSSVTITGLPAGGTSYFVVEAFNRYSYADSAWVAVTTPFYSFGSNGYGQWAEQWSSFGGGWSSTPGIASQNAGHTGRGWW